MASKDDLTKMSNEELVSKTCYEMRVHMVNEFKAELLRRLSRADRIERELRNLITEMEVANPTTRFHWIRKLDAILKPERWEE